jgi:hypothetical protein
VSHNLETRVEKLERCHPSNPYEHMTDAELEARLAYINKRLSHNYGFNTKSMELDELRRWIQAGEQGDQQTVNSLLEQFRHKYGPPTEESR